MDTPHQILPELKEIVEGCKKGQRKFQEQLYRYFAGKMFSICMRYSYSKEEAEDMLQEGFIKAFNHIDKYRGEGPFEGWMRRIFVNTSIEMFRKNSKMYPLTELTVFTPNQNISNNILGDINANDMMRMVQKLSPGYRMAFNLYAIEGFTHKEIGEQLGISEGTSKSQVARARMLLQKMIEDQSKKKLSNEQVAGYGK